MLTVDIVGDKEVIARFSSMTDRIHQKLLQFITGYSAKLQNYVVTQKLSGQVLNHISGNLQASIHNEVEDSGSSIIGRVYSAGCNYAAIHEYGGQIPDRVPVNGQFLHFFIDGKEIFTKFARGFTMPERSFLRSSLADNRDEIIAGMKEAVTEACKE